MQSLAHHIDVKALRRSYDRIKRNAAVGVDGVTKQVYGQNLGANLRDLHERLRTKRYRHQPIRRVHIPKDKGKTRPIGISTIEDKIVQGALHEVLEAIYEQDFMDFSYGFRPSGDPAAAQILDPISWTIHSTEWVCPTTGPYLAFLLLSLSGSSSENSGM
jgi:retron-type reverse transcriptase